ncbi:response regulator [Rhodoferax sp.]|uniref:response regulator n=1 Tax=Rhodoferax sp. TaxID=50421 RepID=UPI0025D76657|nr:response regulator [Rhodoferax sp.]
MNNERDVLTTQQAAKVLGLSTTSVQKMVINGELDAWITPGGHRRIFRSSVDQLLNSRNVGLAGVTSTRPLRILLVEDDAVQIAFFKSLLARIGHKVQLTIVNQANQALAHVRAMKPDLLVTDLVMEPMDGFTLVESLFKEPDLLGLNIIALSAMSPQDMEGAARLPDRVVRYQKPLGADRLCGYLDALTVRLLECEAE